MARFPALLLGGLLLLRAEPAWPMQFTLQFNGGNCGQCAWLLADGVIEPGTTAELRRLVAAAERGTGVLPRLVRFNSPGGDFAEAMRLGRYLRAAGFDTIVAEDTALLPGRLFTFAIQPARCLDACVYAFFGGVRRTAAEGSLALHGQPPQAGTARGLAAEANRLQRALADYALEMGIDPKLAAATAGPGLHVFRRAELIGLKIDNTQVWREETARPERTEPG
jgi:hypothetical protein